MRFAALLAIALSGTHCAPNPKLSRWKAVAADSRSPRSPHLVAFAGCRDSYPTEASADEAKVRVIVTVDERNAIVAVDVVDEWPPDQGFAAAAVKCAQRATFRAGHDEAGAPLRGHFALGVAFVR